MCCDVILTYVIILAARSKLKAQRERREELKLLGELERAVGRVRSVTLPAFEAFGRVIARAVAVIVHHVENVTLRPLLRHRVFIVRAVHVQIVINTHVDVIVSTLEPAHDTQITINDNTIQRFKGETHFNIIFHDGNDKTRHPE